MAGIARVAADGGCPEGGIVVIAALTGPEAGITGGAGAASAEVRGGGPPPTGRTLPLPSPPPLQLRPGGAPYRPIRTAGSMLALPCQSKYGTWGSGCAEQYGGGCCPTGVNA